MQTKIKLISKYQFGKSIDNYSKYKIKQQRKSNQREYNIAKSLIHNPNILNLLKSAYHFYNSVPLLGGKSETIVEPIQGMPPSVVTTNPLLIRQQRINAKQLAGIIPKTSQFIIIRNGEPASQIEQSIVDSYKKLGVTESDAKSMAKYVMESEGMHTPVIDDNGKLIGGISYVDKKKTIEMLRKSGIKNPTEQDINTVIAHEIGHQIETPIMDKEFCTKMGQILDNEGVTSANPNLSIDNLLIGMDKYLAQGRFDNGISIIKEQLLDMPISKANRVMENINRFSGGAGAAYLLSKKRDKINIKDLT